MKNTSQQISSLAQKVAIITGGSRGIGQAIAERLGYLGAKVVITFQKDEEQAAAVVKKIQNSGTEALAIRSDVTKTEAIKQLFHTVKNHFETIDIFIGNAFPPAIFLPTDTLSEANYDSMFAATKGMYFALAEASRHISDGGRILVISTAAPMVRLPSAGAYAGSKAAIEQFVFALAKELGSRTITVNSLAPGLVDTGRIALPKEQVEYIVEKQTPLKRLGQADDIADVAVFLVSEHARWITGQTIQASGGVVI